MFTINFLQTQLANYSTPKHYWLGFSGGLDSTVLLHALLQLPQKNLLRVVHIHHSWPGDDEQAAHCLKVTKELNIPCEVITVDAKPRKGLSLEAIARAARYKTFSALMQKEDCLLTAHHQDDQAETLLLQLLRGAGMKGLAAMPEYKYLGAGYHLRPLLKFSRAELQIYAEEHLLNWIEDHNNFNLEFNRNFIRHKVMPLLKERWPSATKTLARSAKHCTEANDLLDILAKKDLENILNKKNNSLLISELLKLNTVQQRNVLRYWLQQLNISMPREVQLKHIQKDILQSRPDANPKVCWSNVEIRRRRNELLVCKTTKACGR